LELVAAAAASSAAANGIVRGNRNPARHIEGARSYATLREDVITHVSRVRDVIACAASGDVTGARVRQVRCLDHSPACPYCRSSLSLYLAAHRAGGLRRDNPTYCAPDRAAAALVAALWPAAAARRRAEVAAEEAAAAAAGGWIPVFVCRRARARAKEGGYGRINEGKRGWITGLMRANNEGVRGG
jgi:hypothetical protein